MPTESRTEQLLNAYINGDDISNFVPLSRNEQILKDMILGNEQTSSPQSRIESLYQKLDEKIKEGSGGGEDNTLQYVIDNRGGDGIPSCESLFYNYKGSSLDALNKIDTSKVTNMKTMFSSCSNLITIPQLDTSSCTNMYEMFTGCSNLTTIPQLNMNNVTNTKSMVSWCKKLSYLKLLNVKVSLQIGSGTNWGHLIEKDCLIQIISELIDTGSSKTLTMGTANKEKIADTYVKLLEDDGTGKHPFEVCTSTDEGAMTIEAYCNSKNWTLA